MRAITRLKPLIAACLLSSAAAVSAASSGGGAFLPVGAPADAPYGYSALCERDPQFCSFGNVRMNRAPQICSLAPAIPAAYPSKIAESDIEAHAARIFERWCGAASAARDENPRRDIAGDTVASQKALRALLRKVDREVNRVVVQRRDLVATGQAELWQRPTGNGQLIGDCEDIAIEKRVRLVQAGVAPDRLFFATVYRHGFGLHTVLIARMDDGDWVLDSLTSAFERWDHTTYSWLRQEVPGRPGDWQMVGGRLPAPYTVMGVATSA